MTKTEKNAILQWAATLSDEQLENEYYKTTLESLGSLTEVMYDYGWDMADILEQEKLEKYTMEKADVLEELCAKRGIKLWEDANG